MNYQKRKLNTDNKQIPLPPGNNLDIESIEFFQELEKEIQHLASIIKDPTDNFKPLDQIINYRI